MTVSFHELTREDIDSDLFREQLIRIMQESEEYNYPMSIVSYNYGELEYEKMKRYYKEDKAQVILLMDDSKVVSYIWYFVYGQRIHVNEFATESNSRGKGYGSILLAKLFDIARHKRIRIVELYALETNTRAFDFYTRLGFITEKRLLTKEV